MPGLPLRQFFRRTTTEVSVGSLTVPAEDIGVSTTSTLTEPELSTAVEAEQGVAGRHLIRFLLPSTGAPTHDAAWSPVTGGRRGLSVADP